MTNVFIESSDFDIDPGGEDFQFISRIIPDIHLQEVVQQEVEDKALMLF